MLNFGIAIEPKWQKMSRFKLVAIMVQAAKDSRDDITRDEVVEAILLKHIKRDKKFKKWQKEQKS